MGKSLSKILVSLAILLILCAYTQEAESTIIRGEYSNVTGIKVANRQTADALWTDPSYVELNLSEVSIGYMFNLTAWANLTVSSFTWQGELSFNPAYFNATQAGYTGGTVSQFFAGHSTIPTSAIIDNVAGTVMLGESLLGADSRGSGSGSLFWTEFMLVAAPSTNLTIDFVGANSYVLDPDLNEIPIPNMYGTNIVISGTTPPPATSVMFVAPSTLAFYTDSTFVGDKFNVTVFVNCSGSTFAWQVEMLFDPTQIHVARTGLTGVGTSQFFAGHTTVATTPIIDNTAGQLTEAESLLGNDSRPPGGGSLFWVEFQIVAAPPSGGTLSSVLDINNPDTYLLDVGLAEVPATMYDATYSYTSSIGVVHDVAVTDVTAAPSSVTAGQLVYIGVTVANEGTAFESFDVSCQYDSSVIGISTVTLASGATATLSFVWNTAGVPNGVYVISAVASVVPGETNTANNRFVDGRVTVTRVPPPPALTLFVKFTPQTLNLNSKGKWITAHARLVGTKYSAADVDTSTVLLNGTVPVSSHSTGTGNSILMLKFDRAAVISLIQSVGGIKSGYLILVITGQMRDGTSFMAFGMIRVRMPGDINCDGKVDMKDVGSVARRFGEANYDADGDGWVSMNDIAFWAKAKKANSSVISTQFGKTTDIGSYDINEDGKINMKDVGIVAANFGKTYH